MSSVELLKQSFERCDNSGAFSDTFYDIFMSKSDEVKLVFKDTDFSKQKKLLRATVKVLVSNDFEHTKTKKILEDIARTHNRTGHNIKPKLYRLWLDSLCETISRHDPEYSSELEGYWRNTMQKSIDYIIANY